MIALIDAGLSRAALLTASVSAVLPAVSASFRAALMRTSSSSVRSSDSVSCSESIRTITGSWNDSAAAGSMPNLDAACAAPLR